MPKHRPTLPNLAFSDEDPEWALEALRLEIRKDDASRSERRKVDKADETKKRRSEVVTIRLDPKLKYIAELAARKQRRTLSSYIEWAVEESLKNVHLVTDSGLTGSFANAMSLLWDVDEPDRFLRLAVECPDLLNHEEQQLWKVIETFGYLWRGNYNDHDEWEWECSPKTVIWERVRSLWPTLRAVASGKEPPTALPKWTNRKKPEGDRDDNP
jgi:hypothetical protein